jgi:hypothetical protein
MTLKIPIFFTAKAMHALVFGNVLSGLLMLQRWGYRWQVGNERKIKFWKDVWIVTSSLTIQF